jgi:uncharacterized protein (TIGR02996 family)
MTSELQTEQAAFIRAICTDPADDTARLVYADWLDEHDQPARAEFIRVGVELERCHGVSTGFKATSLADRSAELLATHEREWRGWVLHCKRCGGRGKSLDPRYNFFPTDDPCPQCKGIGSHVASTWTRGFVSGIACTLETFETAAKAGLFRMQPVTSARLSDVNIHKTDYPDTYPYTWTCVPPYLLPDFGTGRVKWWHPTEEACRQYLSEQFVTFGRAIAGLPTLNPQVTA